MTQEKHLLFLCFDSLCRFFRIFSFSPFPPSVVVVNFNGIIQSNSAFELFLFSFSQPHFFIVVINLCLYIGLLQFCGVFLFVLFNFNFLNLFFSTLIPLFAFLTVLSPLQLNFNVYMLTSSTSI